MMSNHIILYKAIYPLHPHPDGSAKQKKGGIHVGRRNGFGGVFNDCQGLLFLIILIFTFILSCSDFVD